MLLELLITVNYWSSVLPVEDTEGSPSNLLQCYETH